ncbi:MAG: fumarylacetoacetase [Ignavibacteria bacterium]|nr:fumarylacetoacetase [Ignavibacteria bacterium]MCC7158430.1 fumarylacetoacetase [Ignavibacteria bacterium]
MLKSFLDVKPDSHFSIQNLPYGVFRLKVGSRPVIGVAIGDYVLDLSILEDKGFFQRTFLGSKKVFGKSSLNAFMECGKETWKQVRTIIQIALSDGNPLLRDDKDLQKIALIPAKDTVMCMPVEIGDYTDFYSSKEHATNVGTMFRGKDNALMPNWLHIPIAYHGRASSIVVSGTNIVRPKGQTKPADADSPIFGPTKLLDFELEMGFFIGTGNSLGEPIAIEKTYDHIFGMVLVNDWSARDIQTWEYQPLGPFLAKNFATSISPWVVTMDALEPFKVNGPVQDPEPLPYLRTQNETFDITLDVMLKTESEKKAVKISGSNFKYLYWNIQQQLAHHTVNGCNTKAGDMMASGTISGPDKDSYGSMLELTWRGENPVKLPGGEERKFLNDGDTLTISGYCQGDGYKVGFGEVSGKILTAK